MSRSWKIAVSQKHKHRGEWREEGAGGADPGDVALLEKGLLSELPYCPHAPAPSGLTGRGADKGSSLPPQLPCPQKTIQDNRWHLPSYPTPRLEAHRFKQTTQDNGFKHIRPVLLQRWSCWLCKPSVTSVIVSDSFLAVSLCVSMDSASWLCWPCNSFLITALICFIYAVCRVSSSVWALTWVAVPSQGL